ncbi:hypothetical protein QBC34DRAFT_436198 [Podospora aff. communis PSN243]|uniref:Uncharacterized protein n=1 Tax=Podospora aff. communis PSN243 TaxID=3040156 RepID=A0AAV9GUJ1_9PEZI|nr:hypothetical protein QBC34DRAFT_436198 [Podospora aff. communis PSN243]
MNHTEPPQTESPHHAPEGIFDPWVLTLIVPLVLIMVGNQWLALWITRNGKPVPAANDFDVRWAPRFAKSQWPGKRATVTPQSSPHYTRDINGLQSPVGVQFPGPGWSPTGADEEFEMVDLHGRDAQSSRTAAEFSP